jgi:hypothetical protein
MAKNFGNFKLKKTIVNIKPHDIDVLKDVIINCASFAERVRSVAMHKASRPSALMRMQLAEIYDQSTELINSMREVLRK